MDKIIGSLESNSLTDSDIYAIFGDGVKVIPYGDLAQFNELDAIFGTEGAAIILYETSQAYGHWCLIFKRNDTTVEFFDSLATTKLGWVRIDSSILSNM